jgi:hypothetical protein
MCAIQKILQYSTLKIETGLKVFWLKIQIVVDVNLQYFNNRIFKSYLFKNLSVEHSGRSH